MERERDSNGRFQSSASPAYERARGPDGRFIAQTALQVVDHTAFVARYAESAGNPMTAWNISWLNPMVTILAACSLPTTLASDLSGTSSADGTLNASFLSIFRINTSGLVRDVAGHTNASSLSTLLAGRQCPHVLGLFIERCGAGVPEMSVRQFVNFGRGCLDNRQSGDNCEICLCSMFHADRSLKYLVLAVDKILRWSSYARATIGAQMLRARPLIDVVTDTNPLSGINGLEGWQEAIARIIALRDHAWDFDLRGIAPQLIEEHPDLLKALPCIGSGLFAVTWFLKWWFVKWWTGGRGDDGRIDDIEQVQEADNEEDLPTDNTPGIFAENTVITLIHKRKIANNPVQYRFHIENLPHDADNWAGRYALMELFGSEEALEEAIEKYDSMSLPWDPKLLPRVKAVGVDHVKMFRLGKVWF